MITRFSVLAFALVFAFGCSDPISVDSEAPVAESGRFEQPAPGTQTLTIADIVVSTVEDSGEFSVLLAALVEADLVDAVSGRRILTVFAPTNDAFADLGINANNVGDLGKEALTDILLYHVTPGRRVAETVLAAEELTMLNGDKVTVDAQNVALIDANGSSANIIATDIAARNGIVHIIDAVILP